jgi:hypothetical protein
MDILASFLSFLDAWLSRSFPNSNSEDFLLVTVDFLVFLDDWNCLLSSLSIDQASEKERFDENQNWSQEKEMKQHTHFFIFILLSGGWC